MKPTTWLCLAIVCCSAAAAWAFKHADPPADDAVSRGNPATTKSRQPRTRAQMDSATGQPTRPGARNDSSAAASLLSPGATPVPVPHRRVLGKPNLVAGVSEAEWRKHAELAESQANRDLYRLAALLDLDPVQQDLIFPGLVRQSSSWLPGMAAETISGSAVDASSSEVASYLNSDQQQTLADAELDRQEWWQEILPRLLPPDVTSPASDSPTPSPADTPQSDAPPASKEFEGSDIVIEE
jgi:hypothetical protein